MVEQCLSLDVESRNPLGYRDGLTRRAKTRWTKTGTVNSLFNFSPSAQAGEGLVEQCLSLDVGSSDSRLQGRTVSKGLDNDRDGNGTRYYYQTLKLSIRSEQGWEAMDGDAGHLQPLALRRRGARENSAYHWVWRVVVFSATGTDWFRKAKRRPPRWNGKYHRA